MLMEGLSSLSNDTNMKVKKKDVNGGGGDDPKKKKSRSKPAQDTGVDFNQQLSGNVSAVKGSCEDGNLRACKSKAAKAPKFKATRKRHNLRLVKSKPVEEPRMTREQKKAAKNRRLSNPRVL